MSAPPLTPVSSVTFWIGFGVEQDRRYLVIEPGCELVALLKRLSLQREKTPSYLANIHRNLDALSAVTMRRFFLAGEMRFEFHGLSYKPK
jgi:hypothetical protein